jgi:hypothetical protein
MARRSNRGRADRRNPYGDGTFARDGAGRGSPPKAGQKTPVSAKIRAARDIPERLFLVVARRVFFDRVRPPK